MTAKAGQSGHPGLEDGLALISRRVHLGISCPSINIRSIPFTIRSGQGLLAVQWRSPPATAGDTGSVLLWEDSTRPRASKPVCHNDQACALSPCSPQEKPLNDKPVHCKGRRSSRLLQLEKAHKQEKPSTAKNKVTSYFSRCLNSREPRGSRVS